eukprot:COSAG02_NODE_6276_length_3686_cov_2.296627_5_plen_152_part_00
MTTEAECDGQDLAVWTDGGRESHRAIRDVQYVGVGKSEYHGSLAAITEGSTAAFVEDQSPAHSTWATWGAEQRDVFVLDRWGRLVYKQNLSPGFDSTGLRTAILAALDATESQPAGRQSRALPRVGPNAAMSVLVPLLAGTLGPTVVGVIR